LPLKEILLRNKEEKRRKKNESSRRSSAHRLLGDAGKLSFNFLSALDFSILLRKTSELHGRMRACAVFYMRNFDFFHGVFSL
jgi:hypothetical protein